MSHFKSIRPIRKTGNKNIFSMQTKCVFQKITTAGVKESHIHDIAITKEAPNYKTGDA